jgi:hypothetical protein
MTPGGYDMTIEKSDEKKPILYWITLTIMYVAFVAVILS